VRGVGVRNRGRPGQAADRPAPAQERAPATEAAESIVTGLAVPGLGSDDSPMLVAHDPTAPMIHPFWPAPPTPEEGRSALSGLALWQRRYEPFWSTELRKLRAELIARSRVMPCLRRPDLP
jgi:hypothetical protein